MKKIKFWIINATLLFLTFISSSSLFLGNNNQFINHNRNNNQKSNVGDFVRSNNVFMLDYGSPPPPTSDLHRNTRLWIEMRPDIYNYMLAAVMDIESRQNFADLFVGGRDPYLCPNWKIFKSKMDSSFEKNSLRRGLSRNAFRTIFTDWLESSEGYNLFKRVYTGSDLDNNIYSMPPGYNEQQAQHDFRRDGVIMQFDFVPAVPSQSEWKISKIVKIFPQTVDTFALSHYYLDTIQKGQQLDTIPPLLSVRTATPPIHELSVGSLLPEIKNTMETYFNYSDLPRVKELISIPEVEYDDLVSLDKNNPTTIDIWFFSDVPTTRLYMAKPIRLYIS